MQIVNSTYWELAEQARGKTLGAPTNALTDTPRLINIYKGSFYGTNDAIAGGSRRRLLETTPVALDFASYETLINAIASVSPQGERSGHVHASAGCSRTALDGGGLPTIAPAS